MTLVHFWAGNGPVVSRRAEFPAGHKGVWPFELSGRPFLMASVEGNVGPFKVPQESDKGLEVDVWSKRWYKGDITFEFLRCIWCISFTFGMQLCLLVPGFGRCSYIFSQTVPWSRWDNKGLQNYFSENNSYILVTIVVESVHMYLYIYMIFVYMYQR